MFRAKKSTPHRAWRPLSAASPPLNAPPPLSSPLSSTSPSPLGTPRGVNGASNFDKIKTADQLEPVYEDTPTLIGTPRWRRNLRIKLGVFLFLAVTVGGYLFVYMLLELLDAARQYPAWYARARADWTNADAAGRGPPAPEMLYAALIPGSAAMLSIPVAVVYLVHMSRRPPPPAQEFPPQLSGERQLFHPLTVNLTGERRPGFPVLVALVVGAVWVLGGIVAAAMAGACLGDVADEWVVFGRASMYYAWFGADFLGLFLGFWFANLAAHVGMLRDEGRAQNNKVDWYVGGGTDLVA
jgi:hypothetical protein